jgi:polyisoprenoid-binding protein YceI
MTNLMTEQGMVRVPSGTWTTDPAHSSAGFEVRHMMIATVRGQFREFGGTLEAAEDDPANSHAEGWANVASIDTGNADRDAHLLSADFFDVEHYPRIEFSTTRIMHVEGGHYRVTGDLTMHGVTREIELDANVEGSGEDPWGHERVGVSIHGTIDRTDFGLEWQQPLARGGKLVGNHVRLVIDISAVRAS